LLSKIKILNPKERNKVCIKQPTTKPDKNKNPAFFPDLIVREIRNMLSGPGVIARRIHETKKENSIKWNYY
tara:strand:+ start:1807 stop:2019 length:213 start_codon:yes stop_codon:yes gene_type:complete